MEILTSLMTFFGVNALPAGATFVELIQWFFTLLLAFMIVVLTIQTLFQTVWKIERSFR